MSQAQTFNIDDIKRIVNSRKLEVEGKIKKLAEEIAQREFELLEFNLFISALGSKKIKKTSEEMQKLRKKIDQKKIDLSDYEKIAEEF